MSPTAPVIIEAAINGTTSRERNPHVPRTPEEIAAEAIRCLEAGASIIHNHNDDPVIDMITAAHEAQPYIDAWTPVLERFPGAFLYPTMTGGGSHTTIEQRYGHIEKLAEASVLRMGIVDPGSINLGGFEADGAPAANDIVYLNSNRDIRTMVDTCTRLAVPISFSIFDGSFMRTAMAYLRSGRIQFGGQIKIFFGSDYAPFGIPATEAGLLAYLDMMGLDMMGLDPMGTEASDAVLPWSVALPGGDILESEVGRLALERGGHLRVGLEDYAGPGQPTNLEILERAAKLCEEVGRPVATTPEATALMKIRA